MVGRKGGGDIGSGEGEGVEQYGVEVEINGT